MSSSKHFKAAKGSSNKPDNSRNYWTPLQALTDDISDADLLVDEDIPKKVVVPPIKVLARSTNFIHGLLQGRDVKNYAIKKMSIGIKIICDEIKIYDSVMRVLKESDCQFFTHQMKETRAFKTILFGLDDMPADDVKKELLSQELKCLDVKKITKQYQHYRETMYLVSFENGSVRLFDLRKNNKSLFRTIVRWDYQRKIKNKAVQCHNCQMFGHGERGCNVKSLCANCAGKHKTAECNAPEKIRCANCAGEHKSTDVSCANRQLYLNIRENIRRKQLPAISPKQPRVNRESRTGFNVMDFPPLPATRSFLPNTSQHASTSVWNNNFSPESTVQSGELFSVDELNQLTSEMLYKLRVCKSKEEQFNVITQLAFKYLYSSNK